MIKESLVRMLNQSINQSINSIIVYFLDFYKKAKGVVSLFKMQIYDVFFYLGVITKFAVQTKNKIKGKEKNEKQIQSYYSFYEYDGNYCVCFM